MNEDLVYPQPVEADLQAPTVDASVNFLKRHTLVDDGGRTFKEFRAGLTPRFGVVWSHLALGYVALVLSAAAVVMTAGLAPAWLRVVAGAALIGFWLAFIHLFIHEAAHYNFAPGRERNDRLANVFIGAILGLEVRAYRLVHFEHHRRLGTAMDSERAYFDPLNMRFVAEALLGVKTLRALGGRAALVGQRADGGAVLRQRIAAAILHLSIAGAAVVAGEYALAIAWTLGLVSIMPLLGAVRQLLEHRSEQADSRTNYATVDHGAVNRLFGDGPLASTFGGAGFNRHLLHHWEPQISYTRLREVERFLLGTSAAGAVRERRSTYLETFWALMTW